MTMTKEESDMFRMELEGFWTAQSHSRNEFTLSKWNVVMYRIAGQKGLIRVDFKRRELYTEDDKRFLRSQEKETEVFA